MLRRYEYDHVTTMLFDIDSDAITCRDETAAELLRGIRELPSTVVEGFHEQSIDLVASLTVLFQRLRAAARLTPILSLVVDATDPLRLGGMLTSCRFTSDASLATDRFTRDYCIRNRLPVFQRRWMLIDTICSSKSGNGSLLLRDAVAYAKKHQYAGILCVCVTNVGRDFFKRSGFDTSHTWTEKGGVRHLAFLHVTSPAHQHV